MDPTHHFHHSTLRERIVEHVFVGETLRTLWRLGIVDVEVLRPEFDAHGYDLVLARGKIVRHIQFKTGSKSKPVNVSVATALADKPSGCVIWISVSDGLDLGPYYWFGGLPGEPLLGIAELRNSKRPTPNKTGERPIRRNHRDVPARLFTRIETLEGVLTKLLGPLTHGDSA